MSRSPQWVPAIFVGEQGPDGVYGLAPCRAGASVGELKAGDKPPLAVVYIGTIDVGSDEGQVLFALTPEAADWFALEIVRTAEAVRAKRGPLPDVTAKAAPVRPTNRGDS